MHHALKRDSPQAMLISSVESGGARELRCARRVALHTHPIARPPRCNRHAAASAARSLSRSRANTDECAALSASAAEASSCAALASARARCADASASSARLVMSLPVSYAGQTVNATLETARFSGRNMSVAPVPRVFDGTVGADGVLAVTVSLEENDAARVVVLLGV